MSKASRSDAINLQDALESQSPQFAVADGAKMISSVALNSGIARQPAYVSDLVISDCTLEGNVDLHLGSINRLVLSGLRPASAASPTLKVHLTQRIPQLRIDGISTINIEVSGGEIESLSCTGSVYNLAFAKLARISAADVSHLSAFTLAITDVHLVKRLDIIECEIGNLLLQHCRLDDMCRIREVTGEATQKPSESIRLERLTIPGSCALMIANNIVDYLSLEGCSLGARAVLSVQNVQALLINWAQMKFESPCELEFENTSLRNSFLAETDLNNVRFGVNVWEASRRGTTLAIDSAIRGREAAPGFLPRSHATLPWNLLTRHNLLEKNLASYRALIIYFEQRREFGLAEMFHIGEMEMLRWRSSTTEKSAARGWMMRNFSVLNFYRLISDYGSSYSRAFKFMLGTWVAFAIAFMVLGLGCSEGSLDCRPFKYDLLPASASALPNPGAWAEDFWRSLVYTVEVATLQKDMLFSPASVGGRLLKASAPIVFAAEAALLLFALRRRVRRAANLSA